MVVNVYRANRRFERLLGLNTHEPPDDRKGYSDMLRYPRLLFYTPPEGRVIATIRFRPDKGEIVIERSDSAE